MSALIDTAPEIGYSGRMTNDTTPPSAPAAQTTYSRSSRVGKAWQEAWNLMAERPGKYIEGIWLAERSAEVSVLSPKTMQAVLSRQARDGLLEKRVEIFGGGTRGPRPRVYYRIPQS